MPGPWATALKPVQKRFPSPRRHLLYGCAQEPTSRKAICLPGTPVTVPTQRWALHTAPLECTLPTLRQLSASGEA